MNIGTDLLKMHLNSAEIIANSLNYLNLGYPNVCFRLVWGQTKNQSVHLFLDCAQCLCSNHSCERKSCYGCSLRRDSQICSELLGNARPESCKKRTKSNIPFIYKNHGTTCVLIQKAVESCKKQGLDHNVETGVGYDECSDEYLGATITIKKPFATALFAEAFLKQMFGNVYLKATQK